VDAYVGNHLTGIYVAQQLGQAAAVRVAGQAISPKAYCIAVLRERAQLLELFNRGIRAIKNSGVYASICEKWFGPLGAGLNARIIESIDVGIIGLNHLGIVVSVNSYARKMLNLTPQICLGKHALETPLARHFDLNLAYEAAATGKGFFGLEINLEKDGRSVVISYDIYPLCEEDGKVVGVIISFRDVTRDKKLKESMIRRDKMESLGLLLSNIAHEIRNPLTSIKTFVEQLPRRYGDPRFRREMLKHVPAQIDHVTRLVEQILEYARPRSPVRMRCPLWQAVDEALALLRGKVGSGVNLNIRVPREIWVLADRQQLKQVLVNVLVNSFDAVGQGDTVSISALCTGQRVVIEIEDSGCGIPPEHLPHIFDPFFTTKKNGTGLGLFITHQLIKENGGDIVVTSNVGQGTTVRIELSGGDKSGENPRN
jgi:PAS domain S-box-containing protein